MVEEERRGFMIYKRFHWLTKEELPSALGIPVEAAEIVWEKGVRPPVKEVPPEVEEEKTYLIRDETFVEVEAEEGVSLERPVETPVEAPEEAAEEETPVEEAEPSG